MLSTEFTFNLTEPIKPGKVTIGYFDGVHPSLVAVTRSDRLFVHNPHNRSVYQEPSKSSTPSPVPQGRDHNVESSDEPNEQPPGQFTTAQSGNDLHFLNINQTITCLATGAISGNLAQAPSGAAGRQPRQSSGALNSGSRFSRANSNASSSRREIKRSASSVQAITSIDLLVVGTKTSIHVYDILNNTDLYYKEIPDGANALAIGEFGQLLGVDGRLAMVGGNCAIHGFDRAGRDVYWTVTGDNVTAMALVDVDDDGQNELVVGGEDNEIQVFKRDAIVLELHETDRVTCLTALTGPMFAYALANGTVGVYRTNGERLWRIKSKNQAVSLLGLDVNEDGQAELLTGWTNGKMDIRVATTGEVLYREHFKTSVAGIMAADYNMDGQIEVIVCTVAGEVFGYQLGNQAEQQQMLNANFEAEAIRELMRRRQTLQQELRNYEENSRIQTLADPLMINRGKVLNEVGDSFGAIPAATRLKSSLRLKLSPDTESGHIELKLETTNDTEIRAAICFAEGIFRNESIVVYPLEEDVRSDILIELRPPKDVSIDLHLKALIGYRSSQHYHVFEISRHLPRFSMFGLVNYYNMSERAEDMHADSQRTMMCEINQAHEPSISAGDNNSWNIDVNGQSSPRDQSLDQQQQLPFPSTTFTSLRLDIVKPSSYVIISVPEPLSRVIEWINLNFLLINEIDATEEERRFEFISLRDRKPLVLEIYRSNGKRSLASNYQRLSQNPSFEYYDSEAGINLTQPPVIRSDSEANRVVIFSDSIDIAGDCVQSLANDFLALPALACTKAHFPSEMERLKTLVEQIEDIQNVRQHLMAEVADSANLVRSLVVQAENARLIEEYGPMRTLYGELGALNRDMLREHRIRCQNHVDLVDSLKQINVIIQRASNLRVGTFKTTLINACREAIKQKNFGQLFKIISEDSA